MLASKRIIFSCVLVYILTICNCCDILNYRSACVGEEISISVSFEHPFEGTIFANGHIGNPEGYIGNPNCSSPNMEISSSSVVTFNLSFMDCNTRIKRVEGTDHFQAMNTITIQYHPLIKSGLDCQIIVTCDINYQLSSKFLTSYLIRDLVPSTPVKSKLDIMSGEKLLGEEIPGIVSAKQFLVLNVTDGGKHDHLRIRKCYAHAKNVIDEISTPDLLLTDNICSREGFLDSLYVKHLKVDKSYSDLRDFSEIQNFEISFSQKSFYITCAFDLCSDSCPYFCVGETEINKIHWSTVQTHQVELFDKSFKGFRNREADLRKTIKRLSDRFFKLKNRQMIRKNTTNKKRRVSRLDEMVHVANNVSSTPQEKLFTEHEESNKQIQLGETSSRIYNTEVSGDGSNLGVNQDVTESSSKHFIGSVHLNVSDTKATELFVKRSDIEVGANYLEKITTADLQSDKLTTAGTDTSNKIRPTTTDSPKLETADTDILVKIGTIIADSPKLESDGGVLDKSESPMNSTDCFNASCRPDEDTVVSGRSLNFVNGINCSNSVPDEDNRKLDMSDKLMNRTDFFNASCSPEEGRRVLASENLVTSNTLPENNSLNYDETTNSTSNFNFTASNDDLATSKYAETDCVPYLKFVSVTASLSVLCVSFFLITLFLILYTRKEKKRHNHVSYLYNQF